MAPGAQIHASAIVSPQAEIGAGVEIGPYCVVGPHVTLGDGVRLMGHVHIETWTRIGPRTLVYPFAALGGPGQDLSYKGEETWLEVGADVTVREHVSLHRGTPRGRAVTRIGDRCYLMAQAHVAHDVILGEGVIMAQSAIVAGHCVVGDYVNIGGMAAVHQRTRIGRYAFIGGLAAVVADVIPYATALGNHAALAGFNIVGLKRRGYGREAIHAMRAAYRDLFEGEGSFAERVERVADRYGDIPEVQEVVTFIREDAARALCMPRR